MVSRSGGNLPPDLDAALKVDGTIIRVRLDPKQIQEKRFDILEQRSIAAERLRLVNDRKEKTAKKE